MCIDRPAILEGHKRLDKTKSLCPSLNQFDDIINEANQLVEDSNNWLAAHNLDFVERYIKGEWNLIINFVVLKSNEVYDLVISAVPFRGENFCTPLSCFYDREPHVNIDGGRSKHLMFICDTYPVECPKKIVPSFVWLESAQERKDIVREIFASPSQHIVKIRYTVCKREISFSTASDGFGDNSDSIPRLIQGGPKIVNDISSHNCKIVRKWLRKLDFMRMDKSIRVGLNYNVVWFRFEKSLDSFLKINKVFLSPRETKFCAMKNIGH